MSAKIDELVESVNRLAATDPTGPKVSDRVKDVFTKVGCFCETPLVEAPVEPSTVQPERPMAPLKSEFVVDNPTMVESIDQMRSAAAVPMANYNRIVSILDGLRHAAILAGRPQNAAVRPRIAEIVKKVAGIFKEVDTVQDLNKPLEAIEAAVHRLYNNGKLNDPKTYDFGNYGPKET